MSAANDTEDKMIMKTGIEKHLIKNQGWLTFAAILFFVGAVFRITADRWLEGIIYFSAAVCFTSLQRACVREDDETDGHSRTYEE